MKEPWFWRERSIAARAAAAAMTPAALLYDGAQRLRAVVSNPAKISAPVICIGNATLGGTGKTPFALLLQRLLRDRGLKAHFLSRGFGGALRGPLRVLPQHGAQDVGDEPLLLAAEAPTWIARNRAAGAAAAARCADIIIMDDGFQNPTIKKRVSILLVSAADPCGNGQVFPAGPMREPLARAVARADALIIIGDGAPEIEFGGAPVFRAATSIDPAIAPQKSVAFCGIANPERFFKDLEARGFTLTAKADRIDLLADGRAAIFDYKSGKLRTEKQDSAFSPQLSLTGAMVRAGAFPQLGARDIARYEYIKTLNRSDDEAKNAWGREGDDAAAAILDAETRLRALIAAYDSPDAAYQSQPRPEFTDDYGDYDQLARRKEWGAAEGGDDGGSE